ncbi:hypothetical protein ACB098_05G181200 [Castanea mollissima]
MADEDGVTRLYVESYVLLTTLLIAFLTVFGSCRRRSHSLKLQYSIWSSYLLSTYLINYTMGLMKSATFHDDLFAVRATFLIMFVGSPDCISAYSLEDSEHRKRYNLELFLLYLWLGWLIVLHSREAKYMIPLYLLYFLSLRRTGGRAEALELASKSYGLVRNTKLVADFMEDESNKEGDEADRTCMKGNKYLVKGEKKANVKVKAPHYHMQFETTDDHKVITIDMIWQCKGSLLSSTGDPDGRLKDSCLSYALYRLLCRRFAKYSFSESSELKTWNFVRYGFLSKEGDDHDRAFRVIELELGFLYDLFYTKYPALFAKGLPLLRNFELIIILVTGVVLVAILLMEIVQFFVVNFSYWAKVQWLCYYVKKPSWHNKCIETIIRVICHKNLLKPWDRKLAQYSLLESFSHNPSVLPRSGLKLSAHVTLPTGVKKAIIHSLKTNGQRLTYGVSSLQRNGVNVPSWARELRTQTHVIMVWHIATSLCELNLSSQGETQGMREKISVKMLFLGQEDGNQEIIVEGAKLGKYLIETIKNNELRWKILAELWAEMMLFVAPSDDETAHAEHLAMGGEFVTHSWALRSHAGILKRDSAQDV